MTGGVATEGVLTVVATVAAFVVLTASVVLVEGVDSGTAVGVVRLGTT